MDMTARLLQEHVFQKLGKIFILFRNRHAVISINQSLYVNHEIGNHLFERLVCTQIYIGFSNGAPESVFVFLVVFGIVFLHFLLAIFFLFAQWSASWPRSLTRATPREFHDSWRSRWSFSKGILIMTKFRSWPKSEATALGANGFFLDNQARALQSWLSNGRPVAGEGQMIIVHQLSSSAIIQSESWLINTWLSHCCYLRFSRSSTLRLSSFCHCWLVWPTGIGASLWCSPKTKTQQHDHQYIVTKQFIFLSINQIINNNHIIK